MWVSVNRTRKFNKIAWEIKARYSWYERSRICTNCVEAVKQDSRQAGRDGLIGYQGRNDGEIDLDPN